MVNRSFFIIVFIGLLAGIFSGMIGVGGGIVMVPLLVYLFKYNQYQAQGMSLAVMLPPVTSLAVWNYHQHSAINWRDALLIIVFFIVGGLLGSVFATKIPQKTLRKIFGFIMLIMALKMIFIH